MFDVGYSMLDFLISRFSVGCWILDIRPFSAIHLWWTMVGLFLKPQTPCGLGVLCFSVLYPALHNCLREDCFLKPHTAGLAGGLFSPPFHGGLFDRDRICMPLSPASKLDIIELT